MSGHLPEEALIALRDGVEGRSADDVEARRHLGSCATCRDALQALQGRASAVSEALGTLDTGWDVEAARAHVRARVAEATASRAGTSPLPAAARRRARFTMASLSRAAGILLVTAAAASALPGSPVRRWLSERMGGGEVAATAPTTEGAPAAAMAAETTGVRLSVAGGPLRVVLRDVAPGTELRVVLVPGTEAAVFAPAGSRFTSAEGRVEARVTPGEVRVELPRGVDPVSLEVGGRIYLRSTEAGLDVSGPVSSRTDDEILFRFPG